MNIVLKKSLSRRTMLRGVGTALALPLLESMTPAFARAKQTKRPPVRAAFVFMPNGVVPERWTPKGEGEDFELSPLLASWAELKADFLLLENLWNAQATGRNGHWPKVPAWLSGGFVERGTGGDLDTGGTSVDQVMARHLGHRTALPSFELGIDPPRTGVDNVGGGFPRIVGSYISWRDPHTPVAKEIIPQLAFDRLFRTRSMPVVSGLNPDSPAVKASLQRDDDSVLDLVLEDAGALRRKVSVADRQKLDEYLDAVRSVEQRIEATLKPQDRWRNDGRYEMKRPVAGIPESHAEHVKLMLDIMVLAFWTDSTRISTLMLGDAQSSATFGFLDGVGGTSFHGYSHHREKEEKKAAYEKIVAWHIEQGAYLAKKMKSLDEGEGSLLDNSMLLFGSTLKDGNRHLEHDLPLILAGRGGGALRPGRRVRASKDTPLCNLHLALLQKMGIKTEKFGDSTGALKGLA